MFKKAKHLLAKIDFFNCTQFLKYRGQSEYGTATGGFISLIVIIIFASLFLNAFLSTVRKTTVTVNYDFQIENDPSSQSIVIGPSGFMFALNILEVNITSTSKRYFDISIVHQQLSFANIIKSTLVSLSPCTKNHFQFNEDILSLYSKYNLSQWLCPSLNYTLQVQGKLSSPIFKQIGIVISKCSGSNCATAADIAVLESSISQYTLMIVTIDTLLNPSSTQSYISNFVSDDNIFYFSRSIGVEVTAKFKSYSIQTDNSLLPIQDITIQNGVRIGSHFQNKIFLNNNGYYCIVKFVKSPQKQTYTRSYRKIDDFLSYVGGLVGTVIVLMIIMNFYDETSYLISLGRKLFKYDSDNSVDSSGFNFFNFVMMAFYTLFNYFQFKVDCVNTERYYKIKQQVTKQLDIAFILKRIIYLQRLVHLMFHEENIDLLHLHDKLNIHQIQKMRNKYNIIYFIDLEQNKIKQDQEIKIDNEHQLNIRNKLNQPSEAQSESSESITSSKYQFMKEIIQKAVGDKQKSVINKQIIEGVRPEFFKLINESIQKIIKQQQILGDNQKQNQILFVQNKQKKRNKLKVQNQNKLQNKILTNEQCSRQEIEYDEQFQQIKETNNDIFSQKRRRRKK